MQKSSPTTPRLRIVIGDNVNAVLILKRARLRATSEQWLTCLENNGNLLENVHLKTVLGDFSESLGQNFQSLGGFLDFEE